MTQIELKNKTIHELWNGNEMKNLRQIHKNGTWEENPWCKKCVNGMCGNIDSSELLNIKSKT